jgi:hypothetical protein
LSSLWKLLTCTRDIHKCCYDAIEGHDRGVALTIMSYTAVPQTRYFRVSCSAWPKSWYLSTARQFHPTRMSFCPTPGSQGSKWHYKPCDSKCHSGEWGSKWELNHPIVGLVPRGAAMDRAIRLVWCPWLFKILPHYLKNVVDDLIMLYERGITVTSPEHPNGGISG